ncbi:hypothetical protein L2E82_43521 [Cichorium intybus]|uniref:Uncharacterized protein n=1 Tax=Cichorium intybus TaxID=13427 RepID=A0ACB8ZPQ3_CICIN|nr:hypothetical protein L2E82_43521 [Cichorium intybus]
MFSWCNLNIQKETACKQLVKRFIKVKLLPNADYGRLVCTPDQDFDQPPSPMFPIWCVTIFTSLLLHFFVALLRHQVFLLYSMQHNFFKLSTKETEKEELISLEMQEIGAYMDGITPGPQQLDFTIVDYEYFKQCRKRYRNTSDVAINIA